MLGVRIRYLIWRHLLRSTETNLAMQNLYLRPKHFDLLVLFKIVKGLGNTPDLLGSIDYVVSRGTRDPEWSS